MKKVDDNGFWRIKDNPISKVGVFPYLGKQISAELEPNKIYMVYRPAEELFSEEALESFNRVPVPLVEDHTMIGKDNTPAEEKGVEGVIQNVRRSGDKLIGDIAIYSDHMKDKINDGKKELSMGYYCQYELADGEYNGEHYDAIQREIRSNHVALVDRGRMGSDVRVFDAFCFDAAISTAEFNNNIGVLKMVNSQDADFKESDHPRDDSGKFTSGGGSSKSAGSSKKTHNSHYGAQLSDKAEEIAGAVKFRKYMSKNGREELQKRYGDNAQGLINLYDSYHHAIKMKDALSDAAAKREIDFSEADEMSKAIKNLGKRYDSLFDELEARKKKSTKDSQISEQKGEKMDNLKKNLDGDLVIEHEDDEEKKVADKCGKDADIDKRELIREIGAIAGQAGMSEELVRTLMQKAEALAYNGSEEGKATDEDEEELFEEEEEKKSEDADEEEILEEEKEVDDNDEEDKEKESEDEEEEEIEEKKDIEKSLDALPSQIIKMIAQRDALASKLKPIIGDFNYQTKTLDQVAKYACDALDIKVNPKDAKAAIKGYLAGYKKSAKKYSMDSAVSMNKTNSQIEKYLKGE